MDGGFAPPAPPLTDELRAAQVGSPDGAVITTTGDADFRQQNSSRFRVISAAGVRRSRPKSSATIAFA
jgi:hypothetical protein